MSSLLSLSPSPSSLSLASAAQLRSRFSAPDDSLFQALSAAYGPDPAVLTERCRAVVRTLDRFLDQFGDQPAAVYRAPARLSLNPHCDHQGAWVPYGLHVRELLSVVAPGPPDEIRMGNVDPSFEEDLRFRLSDEIDRDSLAWERGWFSYLDSPAVVEERARNVDPKSRTHRRRATLNYVRGAALRLHGAYPEADFPGLRVVWNGNIAQGGGQSSSSALVVTTTLALTDFAAFPVSREALAERCGEAEWFVGTRGGSGDHAAMLLGSREGLVHLCFRAPFGIRGVRFSRFPSGYELIVANSQTRSEKSAEQKLLFNQGIFAFRFAFAALKAELPALGLDPREVTCLGDLHTGRLTQTDLYRLLLRLPVSISAAELAARFPETFAPSARACFGTDDPAAIPAVPLRGAAIYGLGRVDRGLVMPDLLEQGDEEAMTEFGRLMSVTHDGDRLFRFSHDTRDPVAYTAGRERLTDGYLHEALAAAQQGQDRPLRREPGFYGASISELDRLVDVVMRVEGVRGAGLMGAGGGGYVLILARAGCLEGVRKALHREYYEPLGKEPDVEAWHPTAAAGRLA
jgi:galactokinase